MAALSDLVEGDAGDAYARLAGDRRARPDQPATIGTPEEGFEAPDSGRYPWNEGGYAANAYLPNAVEVEVEPVD